jgi:hypothetical protein
VYLGLGSYDRFLAGLSEVYNILLAVSYTFTIAAMGFEQACLHLLYNINFIFYSSVYNQLPLL